MKTCPKLIWEASIWAWDEWKGPAAERHDQKEEAVKKNDHLLDDWRYILQSKPVYHALSAGGQNDNREGRDNFTGY
jgi:hypothetical protein